MKETKKELEKNIYLKEAKKRYKEARENPKSMSLSKKYLLTIEEIKDLTEKKQKKYFDKKKRKIALKSLTDRKNMLGAFHNLCDEMLIVGYMTEEEHKRSIDAMSEAITDFASKDRTSIKSMVKEGVREIMGKEKEEDNK